MLVYFDDISMVYMLSMDIFHLHLLETINKLWLPFKVVCLFIFPQVSPHFEEGYSLYTHKHSCGQTPGDNCSELKVRFV